MNQLKQEEERVTVHTKAVSFVDYGSISNYYFNSNYIPILVTLESGYKTLEEIHENYPANTVIKQIQNDRYSYSQLETVRDPNDRKKSESSVYRYIKSLIDAKLLVQAGIRVNLGTNSIKNLYGLAATIFIPIERDYSTWKEEDGLILADILQSMLNYQFNTEREDSADILSLFRKIYSVKQALLERFITKFVDASKSNPELDFTVTRLRNIGAMGYYQLLYFLGIFYCILFDNSYTDVSSLKPTSKSELNPESNFNKERTIFSRETTGGEQIILNQEPRTVLTVDFQLWNKFFTKPKYKTIFKILKSRPMTIKEIHKQYLKQHEKQKVNRKEPLIKKIEENTLYKYLSELKKANLIMEAGRIIVPGKNFTEILYTRSAYFYSFDFNIPEKKLRFFSSLIGSFLEHALQKKLDEEKFHEFYRNFANSLDVSSTKAVENYTDHMIIEKILDLNDQQYATFFRGLSLLELLITPDDVTAIKKELQNCFS